MNGVKFGGIYVRRRIGLRRAKLDGYEWVFGPTKASVVNAVFRWDQIGIECTWYDWASDAPGALVRLRAR